MLKTFNCGVGFCIIANPKNLNKIRKIFSKRFRPYVIGKISSNYTKDKKSGKLQTDYAILIQTLKQRA